MKGLGFIIVIMLAFACSSSRSQAGKTFEVITVNNENLQLKNDTLYSSSGFKFFVGQQFIVGYPAGEDGFYRSIIYNTAIVPSIWGQDRRYEHAIENHVNDRKSREGVKRYLDKGKTVTIKGISLWKNSKPNFYLVTLASGSEVFGCDLQFALSLKELSYP